MLVAASLSLLLAALLLWLARRQRRSAGLPGGRLIYVDTARWGRTEKPLYDPLLDLAGKPDYLVQQGEALIPVEVKSNRAVQAPFDSHIFQLAAYCLLAQRAYGRRPPYGILHYPDRTFAVDYTPQLEAALLDVLAEMRLRERQRNVGRSHESPERCRRCAYRSRCDQALP